MVVLDHEVFCQETDEPIYSDERWGVESIRSIQV